MRIKAPAKINPFLQILGKREDGFHEIWTVMQQVSLYDILTIETSEKGIHFASDGIEIPGDASENLAVRAVQLYAAKSGIAPDFRIHLQKNIPIGAGLGGGSSDAAAVLRGLNSRFSALSNNRLLELASELGSDVPFFLWDTAAVCTGRGEKISPLKPGRHYYVIAVPDCHVPTAQVYKSLKFPLTKPDFNVKKVFNSLDKDLTPYLFNNMEETVLEMFPGLLSFKSRMEQRLNKRLHMSGSGSAMVIYLRKREEAGAVGESLKIENSSRVYVVESL